MSYQRLISIISDLSVPPKPAPFIQRVVAWFFPTYANKWKWHRQKQGGRWARIFKRTVLPEQGVWYLGSWQQVPDCPYILYVPGTYQKTIGDCTKEQCNCEVYGSSSV